MPEPAVFPPVDISTKLAIAIGIGMLVGLEREWSQKDLGTRTFAIAAMAGTLSILTAAPIAYFTFAGILLIILLTGLRNIHDSKPVETTTSAALSSRRLYWAFWSAKGTTIRRLRRLLS